MSELEQIMQAFEESEARTQAALGGLQEEQRKLSQQMAKLENTTEKILDLLLEGQTDHNRQIEKLTQRMDAVQQTLASAVVVRVAEKA